MVAVRLSFVFSVTFFLGLSAWAQPTIQTFDSNTFSRLTGKLVGDTIDVNNTIYGGLSGADCGGLSSESTCDSCVSATTGACNTRRIHNDLKLTFSFKADKEGFLLVTNNASQDSGEFKKLTIEGPFQLGSGGLPASAGTLIEVKIPWREICEQVYKSTNGCDAILENELGNKPIRVGLSAKGNSLEAGDYIENLFIEIHKIEDAQGQTSLCNKDSTTAQGLCNFSVFPGDGKAFIDNVRGNCNLPNLIKGRARQARVFYKKISEVVSERDFPDIKTPNPVDLRILSNSGGVTPCAIALDESTISGLTNGTLYSFAMGLVDQAGNVGYVTNMNGAASPDSSEKGACFDPTDPSLTRNCHLVRPDEVVALFQDEFDCFITTAAYGSPTQYQVKTFRQFRNRFLKTNWLGQKMIRFYYRTSPPVAKWIRQNPQSQFWVRMMLWPLWIFAKTALAYPLFLLLALGLLVALPLLKPWRLGR